LISAEGKIASELAMGADALLALAVQPAERHALTGSPSDGEREKSGGEDDRRANRFSNRSLARSKIKRNGLRAGTPAPNFRLPRLDGSGDLTLSGLRGRRVLLIFSSPRCGPCNALAPELEKFHRQHPELEVLMISKGEPDENRAKVKEYGLTFPVILQQRWEISRRYAMFATPIAYLIDQAGVIVNDVAVGTNGVLELMSGVAREVVRSANPSRASDPLRSSRLGGVPGKRRYTAETGQPQRDL
jgi:peroxiredoxin